MTMTLQELQVRAATDPDFRFALIADPRGTLAGEGIEIPNGLEVEIIEATATKVPIVIPPAFEGELTEEMMEAASGGASGPITTYTAFTPGVA